MALQVSTGFKAAILGPAAFEDLFDGGVIHVYSGPQPATADDAPTGTLLGTISMSGAAWTPGAPAGGLRFLRNGPFVSNVPGDSWLLVPKASGSVGWWRLVSNGEDGSGVSYELPRIDGAIGAQGANGAFEMVLKNVALTAGTAVRIQSFFYSIPPVVGI